MSIQLITIRMYECHHIKESVVLLRKILHRRRDIDMKGEYEKKESSTKKKDERIYMKMVMFSSFNFIWILKS